MFLFAQDSPGCPSIRAGSRLILVGPRVRVKIEKGLWVSPPFSLMDTRESVYVCVDTQLARSNRARQLPLKSCGPRSCVLICGFVCPLEDLPGSYTHRLWKKLGVIWAGSSGMLQELAAWSRSKGPDSEWAHGLLNPWGSSQSEKEQSGSLNPKVDRAGCPGFGEVLIKTEPLLWQRYPGLDNQLCSHLTYDSEQQ